MTDVIGHDVGGSASFSWPTRPPGRPGIVATLGVVIVLVFSVAVFSALGLARGGGTQPEDVFPATTVAFARVDLDPPLRQQLSIRDLAHRFPNAPKQDFKGLRKELLKVVTRESELNYEQDIAPWLGDRAGVAGIRIGTHVASLVAVQSRDDAAARRALDKAKATYRIKDGYALIAEKVTTLDEAGQGARLATSRPFADDIQELEGDHVLLAWATIGPDGLDPFAELGFGLDTPEAADTVTVSPVEPIRVIAGVRADLAYVELQAVQIGGVQDLPGFGHEDLLNRLPADTIAAAYLDSPAYFAERPDGGPLRGLLGFTPLGFLLFGTAGFMSSESDCIAVGPDGQAVPCGSQGAMPTPGVGGPVMPPSITPLTPPPPRPSAPGFPRAITSAFGLAGTPQLDALAAAVEPLFEDKDLVKKLDGPTVVSLGELPASESDASRMRVGLTARTSDVKGVASAFRTAAARARRAGFEADAIPVEKLVFAAVGPGYVRSLIHSSYGLRNSSRFGVALGRGRYRLIAAAYVDLDRVEAAYPDDYPEELRPLTAIGFSVGAGDGRAVLRMRVLV